MKLKRTQLLVLALLGFCSLCHAASKPILVYYMPWYVAKPYSSNWGWHWTMNHFDPDRTALAGRNR